MMRSLPATSSGLNLLLRSNGAGCDLLGVAEIFEVLGGLAAQAL